MKCAGCGTEIDLGTVGFGAVCPRCGAYLHACVQCRLYDSAAERCRSLTTEPVRDREGRNYCGEFVPGNDYSPGGAPGKTGADFERLFGKEDD